MRVTDLTGQRFGRLTVIERDEKKWLCRCDCGNVKRTFAVRLNSGATRSCGCLLDEARRALGAARKKRHNSMAYGWRRSNKAQPAQTPAGGG